MRERLIALGIALLPLVFWPGLERSFSIPKLWLVAALAVFALIWGARGRVPVAWPWMGWIAAVGLSAAFAPYVSLEALALALMPLPIAWALRAGMCSQARVIDALRWGAAIESAYVLLQWAGFDPLRLTGFQTEVFANPRMRSYGTLGNPDFVAAWLCATLPLVLRRSRIAWTLTALQVAAIAATGSRAAIVGLAGAAVVMAASGGLWRRWLLAAVPLAVMILWLSPARSLEETIQGRLFFARVSMEHWREIPLAGCGPGSFEPRFSVWQADWLRRHADDASARRFAGLADHAHNDYLEFAVEYGPLGTAALACLCGWLITAAWRVRTRNGAVLAALAAMAAIACVDFPLHRPAEWALFWVLLGIVKEES